MANGKLTMEQRKVCGATKGLIVVAATAGSGKTRCLIERTRVLLEAGAHAGRILLLTFSKAATVELQDRLVASGAPGAAGAECRTLHSWGFRVLRSEGLALGQPLVSRGQQLSLVRSCIIDNKYQESAGEPGETLGAWSGFTPELVLRWLLQAKAQGLFVGDKRLSGAYSSTDPRLDNWANNCYRTYDRAGWQAGRADFVDMLARSLVVIRDNAKVRREWAERYDHVMVDESQDNDSAQNETVALLYGEQQWQSLLLVGDDHQSIYRFRGAVPAEFVSWSRRDTAKRYPLSVNHRSTHEIVAASNVLIRHQAGPHVDKPEASAVRAGAAPVWLTVEDAVAEADLVARRIAADVAAGVQPRDITVLYRTRRQSVQPSRALLHADVPFIVRGGVPFYELSHVRIVLDYLRAATKRDVTALERCYSAPTRYLGKAFLEIARQAGWEWHRMRIGNVVMERGLSNLRKGLESVADAAEAGGAEAGLMAALDVVGTDGRTTLKTYLISHYANGDDDGAVSPLEEDWDELLAVARARPEVDAFLAHVDEMIAGTKNVSADDAVPNAVVLQTCHRCKGLEYSRVYGVGWSQGVLPHARALEADVVHGIQDNTDEERRLAYVTMTRAKDALVLTSPLADSRGRELQPSQFVYEAGLASQT